MSEFTPVTNHPPCFSIALRQPRDDAGDEEDSACNHGGAAGPPHALFRVKFTLTPVG
jgi:hypothetical protein